MSQHKIENLSALMDGEYQDSSVLGDVVQEQQLADKWRSYHLVRDTLRKELPVEMHLDIAANIAMALEDEATILSPQKQGWRKWVSHNNVVPMMRSAGQFAVAASVAVAVIFGVQTYNQPQDAAPQMQNSQPSYALGGISPVSLEVEQPQPMAQADAYQQRRRVIAFLTDHNQQMQRRELHLEPKVQPQAKDAPSDKPEPQQ